MPLTPVLDILISNISANELDVILQDAYNEDIEDVIIYDSSRPVTASSP